MTDPFELLNEPDMSPSPQPAPKPSAAAPSKEAMRKTVSARGVCPFCGQQRPAGTAACPHCTMENTPTARAATKQRIGPWYVLQTRNPSAPGMNYETVLMLIGRGQISQRSVMRGPTTAQLWRAAGNVRGISREFGLCYNCGRNIDRQASMCGVCQRSQEPPPDPDVLLEDRKQAAIDESSHAARLNAWQRQRSVNGSRAPLLPPPATAGTREQSAANWTRDGRVVSAVGLAAALADQNAAEEKPPRRGWKSAGTLAVLAAGAAVLLWARPDYRQNTIDWSTEHWAMLKEQASSIQISRGSSTPQNEDKGNPLRPLPTRPTPQSRVVPEDKQPDTAKAQPADAKIEPKLAPPEMKVPPPQQVVQAASADDPNVANLSPLEQARELWKSAITAEYHDDAEAVRIYERIKKLPSENWPGGLQIHLDQAQHRLQTAEAK